MLPQQISACAHASTSLLCRRRHCLQNKFRTHSTLLLKPFETALLCEVFQPVAFQRSRQERRKCLEPTVSKQLSSDQSRQKLANEKISHAEAPRKDPARNPYALEKVHYHTKQKFLCPYSLRVCRVESN